MNTPRGCIEQAGFGPFFRAMAVVGDTQRSLELIRAFMQCWWETTHTFHCALGEATITPYDFTLITGLPFTDRPIFPIERGRSAPPIDVEELTGISLEVHKGKYYELGPLHDAIILRCSSYPEGYEFQDLDRETSRKLARAVIWAGLSNSIFANSGSAAPFSLLEPLEVWDDIPRLSWGEAGLAELYLALDDASRGHTASFDGFAFALEVYCSLLRFIAHLPVCF